MKVPPGKWRIGVAHRKAEVLFFRFANKGKLTIAITICQRAIKGDIMICRARVAIVMYP